MINVTVNMFSGRRNPSYEIDPARAAPILAELARDPRAYSTGYGPSILGFRGLTISLDAGTADAHQLPMRFRVGDGNAPDVGASAAMTGELLGCAPEELRELTEGLEPLMAKLPWAGDEPGALPGPEATGQRDSWPGNAATIADGRCEVEVGVYSPAFWNSPFYILVHNNCYAYACNMRTSTWPRPGEYAGLVLQHTLDSVIRCSVADGAIRRGTCADAAQQPRWLIALVTTQDYARHWDFHWYRKQIDGYWGHKPGEELTTERDFSGKLITNPETCNRGPYTRFGGYFYATKSMNIAGSINPSGTG